MTILRVISVLTKKDRMWPTSVASTCKTPASRILDAPPANAKKLGLPQRKAELSIFGASRFAGLLRFAVTEIKHPPAVVPFQANLPPT